MSAGGSSPDRSSESSSRSRAVAFVVARLTSSRLPSKQLRPIGGRPLIEWTIEELRRCRRLDGIVVTTVNEPENEPLREFCRERGLDCFWYEGDVNHVTTRLRRAAEAWDAEIGVLVSGDCPLLQAEAIDRLVEALDESEGDYVQIAGEGGSPGLQGIVVGRRRAWQLADDLAGRPELKEHQFPLLGQRPDLFQPVRVVLPAELCLPYHRLSVDTVADLEFCNQLWQRLGTLGRPFNLREGIRLLAELPELRAINRHVHQRTLEERPRKVLCLLDAGGPFGFGHLTRCAELARQIVERLSWPVHFVVDHPEAASRLSVMGFQVSWGTVGRPPRDLEGLVPRFDNRFGDFDLVLIDIFDQRGLEPGWRERMGIGGSVAVIENFQEWAREADLLVGPNVLGKGAGLRTGGPRVIEGPSCLIIRTEVRRLQAEPKEKKLDLVAYLHDPSRRRAVLEWAGSSGARVEAPERFADDFLERLAGARCYLSGFGTSFYEALALGTVPICWPDSRAHREDAEHFYRWMGAEPLIVNSLSELGSVLARIGGSGGPALPEVRDGTPRIVEELRLLTEAGKRQEGEA